MFGRLRGDLLDQTLRRGTLLLGPRQVGKSTLLHQLAESLLDEGCNPGNLSLFDFDDPRIRGQGSRAFEVEEHQPPGLDPDQPRILLLDEVHLASDWASWFKQSVDRDRRRPRSMLRVLATSSAASLLQRGSVESGQGRWNDVLLFGLSFTEHLRFRALSGEEPRQVLQRAPGELERFLSVGGFPEHIHAEPSEELRARLRVDIVDKAVRRDLAAFAGLDAERHDLERMKRLFVYLVQDSGSILNAAERARDLGAKPTTVSGWIQLLVDACLLHRVEPFAGSDLPKAKKRLAVKPKLYASDHGLIPAFTLSAFPMSEEVVRARVTEAVVLRHLLALVESREDLRYFRRREDIEIDFVLRCHGQLHAVEVTSSRESDSKKVGRFRTAAKELGAERVTLIHHGITAAETGGVRLLPLVHFLLEPRTLEGEAKA